jgi:hypothetical protein
MDPRLLPNLRGFLYGIASGGRAVIPSSLALLVLGAVLLASVSLTVWAVRQILQNSQQKHKNDDTIDLVFGLAVIVSVLLSFHALAHDLTVLAVPFAIVIHRFLALNSRGESRPFILGALIFLFYPVVVYLFLFAWSLVFLLGGILVLLAFLVSRELREAREERVTIAV